MSQPDLVDPDTIDLTSTIGPTDTLSSVELDGETVIYDESNGSIHLLDPIATVVWSVLDGTCTLAEICADLAEAFGADPEQVTGDVLALARHLGHSGLLAGVQGDGSATAVPDQGARPDAC
jgi:PqqD family protein of HPr-rel-A system